MKKCEIKIKKSRSQTLLNKVFSFLWPFRETLGGSISGLNFKFGELFEIIASFFLLFKKRYKIACKNHQRILACLFLTLVVTIVPTLIHLNTIDIPFFLKFVIKNSFTFFFLYMVISRRNVFSDKEINCMMKFIVIIEVIFAVFQYTFKIHIRDLKIEPMGFPLTIGGQTFPRLSGTASEPGYLVPILAPALYYFSVNFKKNKIFCILSYLLLALTLSAFAIIALAALLIVFFAQSKGKTKTILRFLFITFALLLITLYFSVSSVQRYVNYFVSKAMTYLNIFGENQSIINADYSASDRNQHLRNALYIFNSGSFFEKLFGRGTGAYSYLQKIYSPNIMVDGVEEAYNLYLSTLTDRGIIGLIVLLALFYFLLQAGTSDTASKALRFGIVIQMIHYFLVGNMWLYFLWYEAAILISYEYYLKRKEDLCVAASTMMSNFRRPQLN